MDKNQGQKTTLTVSLVWDVQWRDKIIFSRPFDAFYSYFNANEEYERRFYSDSCDSYPVARFSNWSPKTFLESPGNLTGPESDFDIKVSRKVERVLTFDEVHFDFLAHNFTVEIFNPFETPSRIENKTA